jgi:biotin carboxyl carrier protein
MKMLTTVSAPVDGIVKEIVVKKGIQIDSDDLLVILEA